MTETTEMVATTVPDVLIREMKRDYLSERISCLLPTLDHEKTRTFHSQSHPTLNHKKKKRTFHSKSDTLTSSTKKNHFQSKHIIIFSKQYTIEQSDPNHQCNTSHQTFISENDAISALRKTMPSFINL